LLDDWDGDLQRCVESVAEFVSDPRVEGEKKATGLAGDRRAEILFVGSPAKLTS
jgi:hypothetical protein